MIHFFVAMHGGVGYAVVVGCKNIERWLNSLFYKMDFQSWNLISRINIFDTKHEEIVANIQEKFPFTYKFLYYSRQKLSDVNREKMVILKKPIFLL